MEQGYSLVARALWDRGTAWWLEHYGTGAQLGGWNTMGQGTARPLKHCGTGAQLGGLSAMGQGHSLVARALWDRGTAWWLEHYGAGAQLGG